jgi:hypothetical protein
VDWINMEFRAPIAAAEHKAQAIRYLTKELKDPEAGQRVLADLFDELGNAVADYPDWHPILTAPPHSKTEHIYGLTQLKTYNGIDHTVKFVRGFITCPYSDDRADKLVEAVNRVPGLNARRLREPLYADNAYPVVVIANEVELEADGTIWNRDALAWFVQQTVKAAKDAQVAETWWNVRSLILGSPHGSRSSLFVNQHTGVHMRKILEALNNSGIFGPTKEVSLAMLSQKKRDAINETLIRAALKVWNKRDEQFEFNLRGEVCKAAIIDTWGDGAELSIRVEIGKHDLYISGFYEPKNDRATYVDPIGKRELAEKFF